MKIGILGGGMASITLVSFILKFANYIKPQDIHIYEGNRVQLFHIREHFPEIKATNEPLGFAPKTDLLFISERVDNLDSVLRSANEVLPKECVVCSIIPGLRIQTLEKYFPVRPIVRLIINFPILNGNGVVAFSSNKERDSDILSPFFTIFFGGGALVEVKESDMDAITGCVCGGTIFFLAFYKELEKILIDRGIKKEYAKRLATQIASGTATQFANGEINDKVISNLVDYEKDEIAELAATTFERDVNARIALDRQFREYEEAVIQRAEKFDARARR